MHIQAKQYQLNLLLNQTVQVKRVGIINIVFVKHYFNYSKCVSHYFINRNYSLRLIFVSLEKRNFTLKKYVKINLKVITCSHIFASKQYKRLVLGMRRKWK